MTLAPQAAQRPHLSACVITFNEAEHIAACLDSLRWCDELVVVDSHSTDDTRAIAAQLGARVVERDWPGFGAQKEFAIRAAHHDWVLCLDADERLSPALRAEIMALRDAGFPGRLGWEMPRLSWYLGRWIRHGTWYPDRCLRLFDRRHGQWSLSEPHVHVELQVPPGRLQHDLVHYPYRSLSDHLGKIDRYTTTIAHRLHDQQRRAAMPDLIGRPLAGFVRSYWVKRGFLDGWQGLLLAYLHAHYVRMKYAKLYALQHEIEMRAARQPPRVGGDGTEGA